MAGTTNVQAAASDYMTLKLGTTDSVSKIQSGSTTDSFSNIMDRTSKKSFHVEDDKSAVKGNDGNVQNEIDKSRNFAKKLKEIDANNEKSALEQNTGIASVTSRFVDELKEQIAQELGISVKELNLAMEEMNIQGYQLFNSEKLGELVLSFNNLEQINDLLLNADAAMEFKNIVMAMETAKAELTEAGVTVSDTGFFELSTGGQIDISITDEQQDIVEVTDDGGLDNETEMQSEEITDTNNAQLFENVNVDGQTEMSQENADSRAKGDGKNHTETSNLNVADGSITEGFNPVENLEQILTDRVGHEQSESILNQLTEQIKVNVNSEFKSMEMQLYPEHLGKVGVQVAVKDGIVTAQISAETEAVKKVIEAQLSSLKENFNNQGLKVENVEVTIASHSFEQNNMSNGEGQAETKQNKRARKVEASLIGEINGNSTDDVAQEIQTNETLGNTVSYSA